MNNNNTSDQTGSPAGLPAELEALLREKTEEDAASLGKAWQLAGHASLLDMPVTPEDARFEQMRREVLAATQVAASKPAADRPALRLIHTQWFRIAASLLILMIAGGIWWSRPVSYEAPIGKIININLADGSEIALNSGSRLTHSRSFGFGKRQVKLKGEAFFDIAHDETPFLVETFNGQIRVLGTRFNVRSWESDDTPETVVALEEGSVLFTAHHYSDASVVLKPGEISRILKTSTPTNPEPVEVSQNFAWRSGGIIFVDKEVGVVVDEIQRRFGVNVEISPVSLRKERVSLRLSEVRSAEEVLSTIADVRGYMLQEANSQYKLLMPE